MVAGEPDTEELIEHARAGDGAAREQLLARHRGRLRQLVAVRLDRRVSGRLDPSDVVQEVLVEAHRRLDAYLHDPPLPFYPWLRQLAWERLVKLHQRHLHARRRSVTREDLPLPDDSALALANRLAANGTSPSHRLVRAEVLDRVRAALAALAERDREVLVMRFLEQLSTADIAAVLGISEGAVRTRQVRALERLRGLLAQDSKEDEQ
jgi:RNA polymerase sigma-70 factor (ECF subfamily)